MDNLNHPSNISEVDFSDLSDPTGAADMDLRNINHIDNIDSTHLPNLTSNLQDLAEERSGSEAMDDSDNQNESFNPPPRLAARFYRPATGPRRKSSATSSRRNSLSSTHSIQSNSSYRQACRNNHVAQYLRRASILEGRKARLAAQQAHAEQVRLRATLAKTAPRNSNMEERVLAAQQARERHLAQVAANCADQVRKAKRIAEETKERRAAQEEKVRSEMEERLAEAEKRRLEYKRSGYRRSRTTSTLPASDLKKSAAAAVLSQVEKEAAVKCLQRTWRTYCRKSIIKNFVSLGLTIDRVHDTTFEEIRASLCDDDVLSTTSRLLRFLNINIDDEEPTCEPQASTRVFLTAFLILGHPTQVMNQDGDQEHDVIEKAKDLIISFEDILSKASSSNAYMPENTLIENLNLSHSAYVKAFADWKAKDKTILIEICLQNFVTLDAIWQSVKDDTDGRVADDYKNGIRNNQVMLMARLKKLAGPDRAAFLIRKAIRESRRQQQIAKRKPIGDSRPRVINRIHSGVQTPDSSAGSDTGALFQLPVAPNDIISNGESPNNNHDHSMSPSITLHNFPPIMPSNRIVSHELVIDKDWRVDDSQRAHLKNQLFASLKESWKIAFAQGGTASIAFTVNIATYIRDKLLKLLAGPREPGTMYQLIKDTLDQELITRQCEQGIFDYQNFFDFMATILPKLCAPVRDDDVKLLAEELRIPGDFELMLDKLPKLLAVIDSLSLDYSNFILSSVAPRLIKEAPEYERNHFAKDLREGRITLQRTKCWWNNAAVMLLTETDRNDPSARPTLQKIYARGLVDLAISTATLKEDDVPETLELDRARIVRFRESATRIAVIGSILLGAKNLLKRDVRAQWRTESNRMWDLLKSHPSYSDKETQTSLCSRLLSIIEASHALPPATKSQLQSTIERLISQAANGRLTDPVARVLFQRLKTHIFNRVSATSSGERVKAVSTASESLATAGLPEFGAVVNGVVQVLNRVSDADREAHGVWYEEIAAISDEKDLVEGDVVQTNSNEASASR